MTSILRVFDPRARSRLRFVCPRCGDVEVEVDRIRLIVDAGAQVSASTVCPACHRERTIDLPRWAARLLLGGGLASGPQLVAALDPSAVRPA